MDFSVGIADFKITLLAEQRNVFCRSTDSHQCFNPPLLTGCVHVQGVLFVETSAETGFQLGQNFADIVAALGLLAIVYRYVLK